MQRASPGFVLEGSGWNQDSEVQEAMLRKSRKRQLIPHGGCREDQYSQETCNSSLWTVHKEPEKKQRTRKEAGLSEDPESLN